MDLIAIGKIRTSHGVRGFVKVLSYSGERDHFFELEEITLKSGTVNRIYTVEEVKPLGDSVILKLEGVNTPELAKGLAGMEILVPRDQAASLEEGEFYHADLLGCEIYHENDTLGRVVSIQDGGGGELFEVELRSGETVLIPFREEFIGEISIDRKLIEIKNTWILG